MILANKDLFYDCLILKSVLIWFWELVAKANQEEGLRWERVTYLNYHSLEDKQMLKWEGVW